MKVRLLLSLAAGLVAALAAAAPASACSCAQDDPRRALMQADGAFVGVLLSKRVVGGGSEAAFMFRVEQVVKGRLVRGRPPQRFRVYSASDGAACGLEGARGSRMGLLVYRVRGRWVSNLCRQMSPEALRRAARPLPRPDGRGPAALLVGGSFGEARTMALDAEGRTLAYGRGTGSATTFAVCPGRTRVAELVQTPRAPLRIAIRALPSLALVRQVTLAPSSVLIPSRCTDAAGTTLVGITATSDGDWTGLGELRGSTLRQLYTARISGAAIVGGSAYVVEGEELVAVDLVTGARTPITRVPPRTGHLTPSPDGRFLAGIASPDPDRDEEELPSDAVLVDLERRTARTASLGVVWEASVAWAGSGRVAYVPLYTRGGDLVVFDTGLTRVGGFTGFEAEQAAVVGTTLWGTAFGALTRTELPGGPQRVVRSLPSPEVWELASALAPEAQAVHHLVETLAASTRATVACPLR